MNETQKKIELILDDGKSRAYHSKQIGVCLRTLINWLSGSNEPRGQNKVKLNNYFNKRKNENNIHT